MSFIRTMITCLVLVLSANTAFAAVASSPTLAVNITVSIDSAVRIEWTNGTNVTTARTWTLTNVDLNQVIASTGAIANGTNLIDSLHVTNRSQVPADMVIGVSAQSSWTHALVAGHGPADAYTIRASIAGGTPAVSTVDAAGALTAANDFPIALPASTAATVSLQAAELAKDANLSIDLELFVPTTVTTNSATMTVTITGSAD